MLIETAGINDAQEILQLQKTAFYNEAVEYVDFTIPPMVQTLEGILEDFHKGVVLKTVCDGKIIGSVRAHAKDGTAYIGRLIVQPEWQGNGIGSRLMQAIENRLEGVARYEIFTGHKSQRTIDLYERLGYRIFRREIGSDKLTMVYMQKAVS